MAAPQPQPGSKSGSKTTKAKSQQLKTGKTKEDAKVADPYWKKLCKHASEVLDVSEAMLQKDVDDELKVLDNPKDFKPFVLYVDEAFKHLYAAFNYKPDHEPGEPFEFDFHPTELIDAIAILAEGLSKKDFKFINEIFAKLQKRCDKLFGVKEGTGAEAAEEKKKRIKAYTTLFICLLKAWVVCDKLARAFHDASSDPDPPKTDAEKAAAKDVREKIDKGEAAKAAIEWIAEVVEALATLIWNPKDRKKLEAWAEEMEKDRKDLDASKDALKESWKKLGLKEKVKTPSGKQEPEPGVKEGRIKEWIETIKALAEVLKQSIAVYEAWSEMHPEDIAGTWKVAGLPDAHVVWTLEIGQTSKNTFEGTLKGHGRAHPDRSAREADWFDEEKATAEISREPGGTDLVFKWKPAEKKKPLFRAAGDDFFYGTAEMEDRFRKITDVEIDGASVAIGQKRGAKAPVKLTRSPKDLAHVFRFVVSVLQLAGALWGVVPEKWRNKILAKVLDAAAPVLKPIITAIERHVPFLLKAITVSIDPEGEGASRKWLISVEVGVLQKKVVLNASWDILKLLSAALDTVSSEPKQSKEERSALVPRKGSIAVKIKQACELKLEIAPWDGAAKDPNAGKNLDRLVAFFGSLDVLESWKSFTSAKGVTVDVGMPRVRTGKVSESSSLDDVLPAVEQPFTFYIDDLLALGEKAGAAGGEVPLKLTLVVGLTTAQVASCIPQLRAVLIAWDIGWTIGSFINEIPAVQRGMNSLTDSIVRWMNYEEVDDRSVHLVTSASDLARHGTIPGVEVTVVGSKCLLFAADEWASEHGIQAMFREGRHPSFDSWRSRRVSVAADVKRYLDSGKVPGRSWSTPGHAMLMGFLLGSSAYSRDDIGKRLDEEVKSKLLHPMQADLARFYLLPFEEEKFEDKYKSLADKFLSDHKGEIGKAKQALEAAAGKNAAVDASALLVKAWADLVGTPRHKELVACMIFQAPDPDFKDELGVVKNPANDRFLWEVKRARGNETLRIEFTGRDRYLGKEPLRYDGRRAALIADCRVHYLCGEMSAFAGELGSERRQMRVAGADRSGAFFTIRVTGGEQTQDAQEKSWFIELDGGNAIVNAFPV